MVSNREGWHYLAVKKLSALLRWVTSKHDGDFCCPNYIHSFRSKNKLESQKKVCENRDFWGVAMPSKEIEMLEFH